MQTQKKRQTFTNEDKQKLLDDYTRSPLSVQKFATLSGVGVSTFERWQRESSVDANCNPTNWPATSNTNNLLVELTAPIESKLHTGFANDFAQKPLPTNPISCTIAVPRGVTITIEAIKADQLAQVIKGLLP